MVMSGQPSLRDFYLTLSSPAFKQGVQGKMALVVNFFQIFEIKLFGIVADMSDLVHDVEAIHGLCLLLRASENLF